MLYISFNKEGGRLMKEFYQQSSSQVQKLLNGDKGQLSKEQILERQEKYGWNQLQEGKKKSSGMIFLEQFKDVLVLILIVAAIVSGFLGDLESTIVILVVITMNAILGTVQTVKAEHSLESLKKMSAPMAKVLRNGSVTEIPGREVTVGDIVYLEAGDSVPADGRILESASMKIDESALTGESLSIEKQEETIDGDVPLGDRKNMVYSGSFVTYGRGAFLVTDIGMKTEMGKIASMLQSASEKKTPLQVSLDKFGQNLSFLILGFCVILFGISVFRGESPENAFLFAVALAVAAIPEALSSIVTIVLSFGTQKMAKESAIIRKLQAVEGLGSVSVICSDKTGTLTMNQMTVEYYYVDGRKIPAENIDVMCPVEKQMLRYSILCNDSSNSNGEELGDPTEVALIALGDALGVPAQRVRAVYPRLSEIPFDSDRKMMSTLHELKDGYTIITKGAEDVLLNRVSAIQKNGTICDLTEEDKKEIQKINDEFSKEGLRVLGVAYKKIETLKALTKEDEKDLIFLGLIAMMDPPRKESKDAVASCKQAGIRPVMITGDHKVTAAAIAKRIGILKEESEACEGAILDTMSDEELKDFVEGISVYARVSPEHKIRIVKAWQDKGNVVAMTGDGVNDAPALKQADIGVAMGITGTEVSKDAASMVLTDDNFATIVKAVENGRNVYANIKNSIAFLLSGNFAAILTVLFASVLGMPVPFAAVHLLFINLLTDSLPAIALGLEPHRKDVMNEKPRPVNESILQKDFLARIGVHGFIISLTVMAAFIIGLKSGGVFLGSTMAFATLCLSRLVHGYNCKSKKAIIGKNFFNNKYLQAAFVTGFLLLNLVLFVPGLQCVFKVAPLNLWQIGCVYGLSVLNLLVIQLLKLIKGKTEKDRIV